jgi:hypothetical protein
LLYRLHLIQASEQVLLVQVSRQLLVNRLGYGLRRISLTIPDL